ncbi:MAG: hypothetical protein ACRC6B_01150, partial [Fusobacteriaceae bacterium]
DIIGLDGKIVNESTQINQTAKQIELIARRTSTEFNKAEMMASNFLFNSGDFVNEGKPSFDPEKKPMYWNYEGRDDINIINDGPHKVIHTTNAEGISYTGVTNLTTKFRNSATHGVVVPGSQTYILSATVKISRTEYPTGYYPTVSNPLTLSISKPNEFETPGVEAIDYEILPLETYNSELDKILIDEVDAKYEDKNGVASVPTSKYKTPKITANDWATVAIIIKLKGEKDSKFNLLPKVACGLGIADIKIKNIQLRMGDQLKEWEPALAQMLDAENMVSFINITPDEIKLDSKLIKIGGGIIVEGENVAVKNLSAARLQLGDNFMFDEGDRDSEGNIIPDTEKLVIKKVQIGQIDALNPSGDGSWVDLETYIDKMDDKVSEEAQEQLDAARIALEKQAKDAKDRAELAKKMLSDISADNKVTGQEKVDLIREYDSLEFRAKQVKSQVDKIPEFNDQVSDKFKSLFINTQILEDNIWADAGPSLFLYLRDVVEYKRVYQNKEEVEADFPIQSDLLPELIGKYTTTTILPFDFNLAWDKAYDAYQAIVDAIAVNTGKLSEIGLADAKTAQDLADKAEKDAAKAQQAGDKAQEQANESLVTVRAMSSDGILTSEEKSVLNTNWIELKESCLSIKNGIDASTMTSADKTALGKKLNTKILNTTGSDPSLGIYLTNLGFFDLAAKTTTSVKDVSGNTVTKEIYGSTLPAGAPTPGKYFDNMWNEAYKARQEVLNSIQTWTEDELKRATEQAILSMYGMYDPFFKHVVRSTDLKTTTLQLYSTTGTGKDPDKIMSNVVTLANGDNGSLIPSLPINFTLYYKNAIQHNKDLHYKMKISARAAAGSTTYKAGLMFLNADYKVIGSLDLINTSVSTVFLDNVKFATGKANSTLQGVIKFSDTLKEAKFIRPYVISGSLSDLQIREMSFASGEDEANSSTIVDIFSDGQVTPNEKLDLKRINEEVKLERTKLDSLINGTGAQDMFKGHSGVKAKWTTYDSSYNVLTAKLNSLTSNMDIITAIPSGHNSEINTKTATYYSDKESLVAEMSVAASNYAESTAKDYADLRAAEIEDDINNGFIVLNGHTKVMGSLVIKSGGAEDANGYPIWTPNSDFTEISGGKIKFMRGLKGANNYQLITELGPRKMGYVTTTAGVENGVTRYFADVSFPFLRADKTVLMISQKSWIFNKTVKSIRLDARQVDGAKNTWRLYLEGTEEDFESYTPQSFSSFSVNSAEPSYIFTCTSFKVAAKSIGLQFPYGGKVWTAGIVAPIATDFGVKVVVSDEDGSNSSIAENTFSVVSLENFNGALISPTSATRHTNRKNTKTIAIQLRVIKYGTKVDQFMGGGSGSSSSGPNPPVAYVYPVATSLGSNLHSYFSITSGVASYASYINTNVFAAGDISYHATEESFEANVS